MNDQSQPDLSGSGFVLHASIQRAYQFACQKLQPANLSPISSKIHHPQRHPQRKVLFHVEASVLSHRPHPARQRSLPAMTYYRNLGFYAEAYEDGDGYAFLTRDKLEIHLRTASDLIEGQNPAGSTSTSPAATQPHLKPSSPPHTSPFSRLSPRASEK
jgi:hypothetical protein